MSDKIKIPVIKVPRMRVPEELLPKISGDSPMARAMSSLLWLKSIYKNGKIKWIAKNYESELYQAAIDCRISISTMKRRINFLLENKLITYEDQHYKLASWDTIKDTFSLTSLYSKYVKVTCDPYKVLQAMFFRYPVDQCKKALRSMITFNPYLKETLLTAVGSTRFHHIAAAQIEAFVKKQHDHLGPDAEYALSLLEADPYVGTQYYKKFMGLTGRGSIAYRKRDLQRRGLIEVQHRRYDIANGLYTTEKQRKSHLGYCAYLGGRLQLIMPDQISFNL